MATGTVSSKFQLTLPASVRKALGIKPGDKVEYSVVEGRLEVRVVRPDILEALDKFVEKGGGPIHTETGGDATAYVRKLRWGDDDQP